MAMEHPKWLKEDLKLTDEEFATVAPIFQANGRMELIEKGYLRQGDYSRRMNEGQQEIERQRAELATANERLTAEMVEWGQREAQGKTQTEAQIRRMEAAEARALQLQQTLERTANTYGLDPASLIPGAPAPVATLTPTPQIDTSQFVNRQSLADVLKATVHLPAELMALADEHFSLTGQRLDTRQIVAELQTRAEAKGNRKSLDIRQIWEETHDIPAKKQEAEEKARKAENDAAYERGRMAGASGAAVPGAAPGHRIAPIFHTPNGEMRQSALARPAAGTTVQRAAAALATARAARPASGRGAST